MVVSCGCVCVRILKRLFLRIFDKLDESQRLRAIKSHNSYQYFIRAGSKDPVGKYHIKKNQNYEKKQRIPS